MWLVWHKVKDCYDILHKLQVNSYGNSPSERKQNHIVNDDTDIFDLKYRQ